MEIALFSIVSRGTYLLLVPRELVSSVGDSPHPVAGAGPQLLASWHCGQPGGVALDTAHALTRREHELGAEQGQAGGQA